MLSFAHEPAPTGGLLDSRAMRVLGLDLGARRIGLALSDPDARIALPEGALKRTDDRRDLEALCALVRERGVARIVVGLPLHMNGRAGEGARAATAFAERLAEATGLPVDTLDERWSTREAERALQESGRRSKKRRAREREAVVRDAMAATLILRTYLEQRSHPAAGAR